MNTSHLKLLTVYPYAEIVLRENHQSRLNPDNLDRTSTPFMTVRPKFGPSPCMTHQVHQTASDGCSNTIYLSEYDGIMVLVGACKAAHEASVEYISKLTRLIAFLSLGHIDGEDGIEEVIASFPDLLTPDGSILFSERAALEAVGHSRNLCWLDVIGVIDFSNRKLRV